MWDYFQIQQTFSQNGPAILIVMGSLTLFAAHWRLFRVCLYFCFLTFDSFENSSNIFPSIFDIFSLNTAIKLMCPALGALV